MNNVIKGHGTPTTTTPGIVGDYYIDLETDTMYICVEVNSAERGLGFLTIDDYTLASSEYIWELCNLVNNQDKFITRNGEYAADDGYDGLGNILVDVTTSIDLFKDVTPSKHITSTKTKICNSISDMTRYVQVKVNGVHSLNSIVAYRLGVSPLSFAIKPDVNLEFTIELVLFSRTVGTDGDETEGTCTLTISNENDGIYAKIKSNAYCLDVTSREVYDSVGQF